MDGWSVMQHCCEGSICYVKLHFNQRWGEPYMLELYTSVTLQSPCVSAFVNDEEGGASPPHRRDDTFVWVWNHTDTSYFSKHRLCPRVLCLHGSRALPVQTLVSLVHLFKSAKHDGAVKNKVCVYQVAVLRACCRNLGHPHGI